MKHLSIITNQDVRLAQQIYTKLSERSYPITLLYDSEIKNFYVFGYNANILKIIIEENNMNDEYPTSIIDNDIYYKIPTYLIHTILSMLVDRHFEIRII